MNYRIIALFCVIHFNIVLAQEINIGIPYLPASYDPHKPPVVYTTRVLGDIYEGLVAEAADGSIISGTAESWERSKDGLQYTFKIRKNAKWSDGKPVTAHDYFLSFQRLYHEKSSDFQRFKMLTKKEDWAKEKPLGVKVINNETIQFSLSKPYSLFLHLLITPSAFPVPSHQWDAFGSTYFEPKTAVTNGAYTFADVMPSKDTLSLVKNVNYWDREKVSIDSINYHASTNSTNASRNFASGKYDVLYEFEGYQYQMLSKQFPDAIRKVTQLHGYYILFNHNLEALKNPKVRKALSLAIDREQFVKATDAKNMQPLYTIVPKIRAYSSNNQFEYDLSQAKRLMKSAGYSQANPLKLKFTAVNSKQDKRILSFLKHVWMAIDIHIDIQFIDFKSYIASINNNTFELSRLSWFADLEDALEFMVLHESKDKDNYGEFKSTEFDKMIQQAISELEPSTRNQYLASAEEILVKESVCIPVFTANILSLVHPKVKGWVDNATNTHRVRWLSIGN